MLRRFGTLGLGAALAAVAPALHATPCYVVYGADDAVLYRSSTPPVDMSTNVRAAVAQRWPGSKLIWLDTATCPAVQPSTLTDAATNKGKLDSLAIVDEGARMANLLDIPASPAPPSGITPSPRR